MIAIRQLIRRAMGPRNKSGGSGKVGASAYGSAYGNKPEGSGQRRVASRVF